MALDRLTQITSSGISSTAPLTGINITGVITATSITATNYGSVNATTLNASGVSTFQASSFWGDGDVAYFGDGQDLLIFHNSTDSIIRDNGTGDLFIEGGNRIKMTNPTGIETYAVFNQDGAVELWYDNSKKLETSGIGVTVTGRLDVGTINATGVSTFTSGPIFVGSGTSTGTASQPLQVTGGAYVSGNIGVGATNPSTKFHVSSASGSSRQLLAKFDNEGQQSFYIEGQWGSADIGGSNGTLLYSGGAFGLRTGTSGNANLLIDSSGKLGIGTNNPYGKTHIEVNAAAGAGSGNACAIWLKNANQTANNSATIFAGNDSSAACAAINFVHANYSNNQGFITFDTRENALTYNSSAMKIDAYGRVTNPYQPSFAAWLTASQTNVTGNGVYYTLICNSTSGNSPHNVGGHYNTSTGVFTAPISGYYQFNAHILYSTDVYGRGGELWLSYNNDTYRWFLDRRFIASTSGTITETSGSVMIYVVANDNIRVRGFVSGGSQNISILGNNTESSVVTHFTGRLLG